MTRRPTIALAMMDGLTGHAFGPDHLARLERIGTVLDPAPLTRLDDDRARAVLAETEVLLGHWGCPTLTADVLALAPRLECFAYAAGTVKWQVTDAVWERDLLVTSAAAANAVPVAEYTVAMILLANKGVLLVRELQRDPTLRLPLDLGRVGNVGKTVGIIGASFVGRLVIELLRPFDLRVRCYDPYLSDEEATRLGVHRDDDLLELCRNVDVLSLHAPDIESTRNMLRAEHFAALRDGAVFVNTARPALVDQDALEAELVAGRISAVLDVATPDPLPADHRLLSLANVFVTPHVAGSMGTELARMADLAIDEIERFATGLPPLHPVRRADLDRIA